MKGGPMAELVDIRRVEIDPNNLTALVRIADDCPLMTSEDLEGTTRVYRLLPHIVEHACVGDAGDTFRDAMGNTEMAHLLEHITVELLAQTNLAGDMLAGRTWVDEVDDRTYKIELACEDDVLVSAALSCGVWILDWAFSGGGEPKPDVDAIVSGLVKLVKNVAGKGEHMVLDFVLEDEEDAEEDLAAQDEAVQDEPEPEAEAVQEVEPPRPLWTPAPEVPARAARARRETVQRVPEVEAEIDQIMATIESPALDAED